MYYLKELINKNWVLSCDGVRIKFELDPRLAQDVANEMFGISRIDIENYPPSFKPNNYKFLNKITYADSCNATVGYCFNGFQRIDKKGYDNNYLGMIDFNLNKVGSFEQFWADYRLIKSCSTHFEVVRVDLALDVPYEREFVYLQKDQRVYSNKVYSRSNRTEYLGLRNNIGRVKVYNKSLELKRKDPLTRIEVTCELSGDSFLEHFPKVYYLGTKHQMTIDYLQGYQSLNDTDRAIIQMANELIVNGHDDGLTLINSISHQKKQKLKPYILPEFALLGLVDFKSEVNAFCYSVRNTLSI